VRVSKNRNLKCDDYTKTESSARTRIDANFPTGCTMKPILSGKSILIIEDYPAMRKAIRDMLYSLEADTIYEADNGNSAINIMGKHSFDAVLCDYNLGEGKNGQQVLEEARHRKLIGYHCVFIIISAEQATSMVLGAMDNKPDEYLTKPFNAQQLFSRLERNFIRKAYLQSVEREMERGNLPLAAQHCDKLLALGDKKMRSYLLKIRAELAISLGDFDKSNEIYHAVLQQRELPWAKLGLAIVEFKQGHIEQAIASFEALLKEQPLLMEGYDWLAKAYEAFNNFHDAQTVLHQAIDLSPQSLLRQKKLGETADKNGNLDVATKAYQAAVSLGKNSVFKSCADFSNLAKLYAKTDADRALKTLKEMCKEYENSPEAELRAATLEAELHKNSGQDELAQQALQKALTLNTQLGSAMPKDLQLDLVRTCFLHDEAGQAESMLDALIKTNIDDDQFLNQVRRMQSGIGMDNHSEVLIQTTKQALVAANNKGVSLYKQGKFKEAMALFEQAMLAMPDNQTIILNTLKIIIHDLKTAQIDDEKMQRAQTLFKKAQAIGIEPQKLGVLQMEFAKLSRQYASEGSV